MLQLVKTISPTMPGLLPTYLFTAERERVLPHNWQQDVEVTWDEVRWESLLRRLAVGVVWGAEVLRLGRKALRVAQAILRRVGGVARMGYHWEDKDCPLRQELADEAECSTKTVTRTTQLLRAVGLLTVTSRKYLVKRPGDWSLRERASRFTLTLPFYLGVAEMLIAKKQIPRPEKLPTEQMSPDLPHNIKDTTYFLTDALDFEVIHTTEEDAFGEKATFGCYENEDDPL